MRARPLLPAIAVTSALLLSAAPAVASGTDPVGGLTGQTNTGQQSGQPKITQGSSQTTNNKPVSGTSATSGTSGKSGSSQPGASSPNALPEPLQSVAQQLQNGLGSGKAPDVQGALTGLGSCVQAAGMNTTTQQKCFETFFANLGLSQAKCFSQNGFTIATVLQKALMTQKAPDLATMLQGLLACLMPKASSPPASTSGGGGGTVAPAASTSSQAPAATPMTGTPTFTG